MATFEIPNNLGQVRQVNRGERFGELYASKNLDLNYSPGKVRVSKKLKRVFKAGDDIGGAINYSGKVRALLIYTNLDLAADNKYYYAFTTGSGFFCSIDNDPRNPQNWSEAANPMAGDFNNVSDAVVFAGLIRISTSTNIARFNGSGSYADNWWTAEVSGTALTANKPHTLHVHHGGQETLLVTDANRVRYYNTTAGHTTLTLAERLVANTLASGVDTIWVGTYSETTDDALVYEFNIGNTLPNAAYRVDGRAVLSMETIDNIPYIVTERGHIQRFTGAGFETVASFPFANKNLGFDTISPGIFQYASPPIYPKGMRAKDRSLFINFSTTGKTIRPIDDRTISGVWEYNVDTGALHHRYSIADNANEYGYLRQNEAGPILLVGDDTAEIMVGAGTEFDGLYIDSTETPEGYLITPEYYGDSITQAWEKVHAIAKLNGGSINVKYRTESQDALYINGVAWVDGTRFNTTENLASVQVGDEVEIVSIHGAGRLAHVTKIEQSSSTWSVTIDESIGTAGQTSNVRFENWRKVPATYTAGAYGSFGINQASPMLQLKVQLTGNVELQRLITKGNAKAVL